MIWKIPNRRCLLVAFLAFFAVIGSLAAPFYGEDLRSLKYGISILGGVGDAWYHEPDFTVYGVLPRVDVPLHPNWDLEFEGNYSYWNIREEKDLFFLGFDVNLLFKPVQGTWGSLFLLAGEGLVMTALARKWSRSEIHMLEAFFREVQGFIITLGKGGH